MSRAASYRRILRRVFPIIGTLALLLSSVLTPAPARAQGGTIPLPPVLVETSPADGAAWDGGPVTFVFDQTLGAASASGLTVQPALAGEVAVQGERVVFTPGVAPEPGQRYIFTLQAAPADENTPAPATVTIGLSAATPLQVTSTQPSDGVTELSTTSQIVIAFNRPVVPLGEPGSAALPPPFTIEPAVEGQGEWINTSVYVFKPALGLAGGTQYTITVADITGLGGETLAEPYVFTFSTAAPTVVSAMPTGEQIRPDATVQVMFSQPMDPESTEAAFTLRKQEDGSAVEGAFGWSGGGATLTFTPTERLEFGALYDIVVSTEAQPASRQGALAAESVNSFRVVPLPSVLAVSPENGAVGVSPDRTVVVRFSAPVSPTMVLENVSVSPAMTNTTVYSYYSEYNGELQLSWFKQPNTTYTVTIGGDIADEYGNTLGEPTIVRFTTGDYTPYVRVNLDQFTHFSAYTKTLVSVYYRNVDETQVSLYRLPVEEFYRLTGQNQWEVWRNYNVPDQEANLIWSRTYKGDGVNNESIELAVELTDEDGNPLPPGIYFLEAPQPPGAAPATDVMGEDLGPAREQKLIVLSNYNLVVKKGEAGGDSLAWLTELRTGEPVAGKEVRFSMQVKGAGDLGAATTDADGVAVLAVDTLAEHAYTPVIAAVGEPGDEDFSIVVTEWNSGIAPWDFNLPGGYYSGRYQTFFYTDRPIYQPGQTVHWKGLIRGVEGDFYRLPPRDLPVSIVVRDGRGNAILEEVLTPNEHGTISGDLPLATEAFTGWYFLEAQIKLSETETVYGGAGFQVAFYEKPEFAVTVASDKPEYVQGDTIQVTLQADYFSGGPLAGAPVTWRLIADPYFFFWQDPDGGRWWTFEPYDPEEFTADAFSTLYFGVVREGEGETGPDGSYTIEVPAEIFDSPRSLNFAFDFTVQSSTNQFVNARAMVPVHKGDFYIGLSPQQYVGRVGEPLSVDVLTLESTGAPDNQPYPDVELDATVYEFVWSSVFERASDGLFRWRTDVERTPVYSDTLTTGEDGRALLTWTPEKGGQYQVVLEGEDGAGHAISSAAYVWVSAAGPSEFVAWPRENNDRIELVADQQSYAPGDTASILVPNPFTGTVKALVTIERNGVLDEQVIDLEGSSETIEVPVSAEYIPNVYVGVVLIKGIDETNPTAAMRVGFAEIKVDVNEVELDIQVTPSAEEIRPGETLTFTIQVNDSAGDPVEDAELSVALVDKAVLSLAQSMDNRTITQIFYDRRPLAVRTGVLLTINRDRQSQMLSEGAKGGGGGDGGMLELREEFPDIAFWRAHLVSDEDGRISFSVDMPDNLTTWVLFARGITPDTKVGEATHEVVASKPLQVRTLLPRFFTAGDRVRIGAVVLNTSDEPAADGALAVDIQGAEYTGETALSFDLEPGSQTSFDLPIEVADDTDVVTVTFAAEAGDLADAVRLAVPVRRYQTPESYGTAGTVPADGVTEAIATPAGDKGEGSLEVGLEASVAAGMEEGLSYLEQYPYEPNEATISRFMPNIAAVRALRTLDVADERLEAGLRKNVTAGVQMLVARQNADGGWGFWPHSDSSPFITAYALWSLGSARDEGFTVPDRTINAAAAYLDRAFAAPDQVTENWRLDEMAFMHFVLAELDQGDPGRASTLYDARDRMAVYGKAFLAMAMAQISPDDARVQTLLDDLYGSMEISAAGAFWHEQRTDWWTLSSDIRSTAIALQAFIRLDPEQPVLSQVVRWLMAARVNGRWPTTQENAWSIIALSEWMETSGELEADYEWSVTLNGDEMDSGRFGPEDVRDKVVLRAAVADLLAGELNTLHMERSGGPGVLYYTTYLRTFQDALAVEPADRGMVVERRFNLEGEPVATAQVGDVISVTVSLVVPSDRYHVQVEVPIPAGAEPINPALATEQAVFVDMGPQPAEANTQPVWTPSYVDIRNDRVAFFATHLPAGAYTYTFLMRATVPGEYRVLPAHAQQMYLPEVWGRSGGAQFTVTD